MTTVFISGSKSIKKLDERVKDRIDNIVSTAVNVIVGDADGIDSSIQEYLANKGARNAVVYCSGARPRNNRGDWSVATVHTDLAAGTRAFYTAKDLRMADEADFGLMVWDAKSTGTLANVLELLARRKKSVVFVNKDKEFHVIREISDLKSLVSRMSEQALLKAEAKVSLKKRLAELEDRAVQNELFGC